MRIAILGGGLTGLTLGYLLKQKGAQFEIIEKEESCGGLMRTLQEQGFTFDCGGSHVIFSKDRSVLNFMLSILGENRIRNKRNTKIYYKGAYVKYPFENGLAGLSKQDNFECLHDFLQSVIKRALEPTHIPKNFREWCYDTFGKAIAEKYLIPYNEKIWKFPTDKISTEWVQRLPNPPLEDVIKSSLGFDVEGYTHQLFFYYPRAGGIYALISSLTSGMDGNIINDFNVTEIRKEHGAWIISDGNRERSYDRLVSTIPLPHVVKALHIEGSIADAAKDLKCNSLITVMFGLNVAKLNSFSWVYIPDEKVAAHRISFPSNYSPHTAPKGKSSILAEITCNTEDAIWRMKDAEIVKRVSEELQEEKMLNTKDICYSNVKRTRYAYVVYDRNHRKNVNLIRKHLKNIGIDLVGRFAEFEYLNMDGCIRHAIDFVNNQNYRA